MVEEITKRNQETEIANQDAKQKIEQLQGTGNLYLLTAVHLKEKII
jgi:hypothetical protein